MDEKELQRLRTILERIEERLHIYEQRLNSIENARGQYRVPIQPATRPAHKTHSASRLLSWRHFEFNIGTYILQILGIAIFMVGVVFLFKYSIDRGWVTPPIRVLLGLCLGTALLALAELWRRQYHLWARACSAGGIGLCYISVYAAYSLYQFLSGPVAFAAFIAITVLATGISLWHTSATLALLSLCGACLTPLVVGSYVAPMLAAYLVVVAGLFSLVAAQRRWYWLPCVSLLFLSYYYFFRLQYSLDLFSLAFFIIGFFSVYSLPYCYGLVRQHVSRAWELASVCSAGILSLVAWYCAHGSLLYGLRNATAFVVAAFILGGVYAAGFCLLRRKNKMNVPLLALIFSLAIVSFFVAIITQWQGYEQSMVLNLFGFAIFILSIHMHESMMRLGSYVVWVFSSIHMLCLLPFAHEPGSLIVNSINSAVIISGIIFLLAAYYASFIERYDYYEKRWLENSLIIAASATFFYWFQTPVWQLPYNIVALIFYTLILFVLGITMSRKLIRQCAYVFGVVALVYFAVHYLLTNVVHPQYAIRLHILFISGIAAFIIAMFYTHYHAKRLTLYEQVILPKVFRLGAAFFIYAWIRAAIIIVCDPIRQPGLTLAQIWGDYDATTRLARTHFTNVLLTVYYAVYALIVISIGLVFSDKWLRYLGFFLVVIALAKLGSMIMVMPNTFHRIVAFICVGLLLILGSFLYQRLSRDSAK